MTYAKIWLSNLLLLVLMAGCALTVTPDLNRPSTASYSGTKRDSGVVGTVQGQFVIDAATRTRFNALIARYGKGTAEYPFLPPVTFDFGISPRPNGTFLLTPEAETTFGLMNRWAHSGKAGL